MLRRLPDTLFFSLYDLTDPFPAPVHAPGRLPQGGAGGGGHRRPDDVPQLLGGGARRGDRRLGGPGARLPVRHLLVAGARAVGHPRPRHAVPGGRALPRHHSRRAARARLPVRYRFHHRARGRRRASRTQWRPSSPDPPTSTPGSPVPTTARDDLRLVFVGDDRPRKGLTTLLDAMPDLGPGFALDVVGPHDRHRARLTALGAVSPRVAGPGELRQVLWRADVVVAPATSDRPEDGYGDTGMVDGFPTTEARVAMLSGCCLVGSNPDGRAVPDPARRALRRRTRAGRGRGRRPAVGEGASRGAPGHRPPGRGCGARVVRRGARRGRQAGPDGPARRKPGVGR